MPGSLSVCARREGGVLVVDASGDLTLEALLQMRALINTEWEKAPTLAAVVDHREVCDMLSPREWEKALQVGLRWAFFRLSRPLAFVVRSEQLQDFHATAMQLAAHGILQAVFTDPSAAIAWATSRRESSFATGPQKQSKRSPVVRSLPRGELVPIGHRALPDCPPATRPASDLLHLR